MSEVKIKVSGGESKSVPASIFGADLKAGLLHQTVRWQRAKARKGCHKTLTRTQVSGGGKKPWKQKGLGRARAGSSSSPIWVGGGTAHGPKLRDYSFDLNKKEKRAALCGALTARNSEGKLYAVKDLGLKEIKTSEAVKALEKAGVDAKKSTLVVAKREDELTTKSIRNIGRAKVVCPEALNVYDVLNATQLVIVGDALDQIVERLS